MTLDDLVNDAVKQAVIDENQSESLASKIIAWLTAITSGNETLDDIDNINRRVNLLYEDVQLSDHSNDVEEVES
jgi:agmatine/peptidylarginine deiminase